LFLFIVGKCFLLGVLLGAALFSLSFQSFFFPHPSLFIASSLSLDVENGWSGAVISNHSHTVSLLAMKPRFAC